MESGGDTARGFGHMPWDKYAISRNNRVLKEELEPELKKHLEIEYDDKQESTMLREALKSIQGGTAEKRGHLDPELYEDLICQLKSLVFAGYDTTASSLCWMVKLLQDNPQCLAKMRAEHDKVLGTNVDDAASVLKKSPNLLNALPYTQAVVKETLRLYPIAFAIRQGVPGKSSLWKLVFVTLSLHLWSATNSMVHLPQTTSSRFLVTPSDTPLMGVPYGMP